MERHIADMLLGATGIAVAPIIGASFAAITGKQLPEHWLSTRTQTMISSSGYMRGRNAKLAGLAYDPTRVQDWRMGWLETNPEANLGPEVPADWKQQVQAYRHGVQSATGRPDRKPVRDGEVALALGLSPAQAAALAHFVNCIGTQAVRATANDDGEADLMRDAIIALADALSRAGYAND